MNSRLTKLLRVLLVFAVLFACVPAAVPVSAGPVTPPQTNEVVISSTGGTDAAAIGVGRSDGATPSLTAPDPDSEVMEGLPAGPEALLYENGQFYILDTLNQRVLRVDALSGERETYALPGGYYSDMKLSGGTLYLRDAGQPGLVSVDTLGGLKEPAGRSADMPTDLDSLTALSAGSASTERVNRQQGWMTILDPSGAQQARLEIKSEYYLGSARYQGRDQSGNYYVLVEELLEDVPTMLVETTVRRYAADGSYLDTAVIPMDEVFFFPTRAVAVDPEGGAYFLQVSRAETSVVKMGFNPEPASTLPERWEALQNSPEFQADIQAATSTPIVGAGSITRQQIISNAKAYMNVNWTLGAANYYTGQAGNWDNCGWTKQNWRLPRYLTGRSGQTIAQVPYAWGGYQSIANFRSRISSGNWAGNTCGNQVLGNVAGVDCSGYVSQVLQAGGYYLANNNGLGAISTRIEWNQLRPGDLLLKSGSHVMLFDTFNNGQNLDGGVWVYESSVRGGSDRVDRNLVNYSTASQYTPRKYNNVAEDRAPANQNVIRNGTFSNGTAEWSFWGEIDTALRDGMLYFKRRNPSPNAAVFYQDINYISDAGYAYEISANVGNTSNVNKQINMVLHNTADWTGTLTCSFTVPANSDPKTYRVTGALPARWENARFELSVLTADGLPDLTADNISIVYRPDLHPSSTSCTVSDPPPASTQWLTPSYTGSGWVKVSDQNQVSCTLNNDTLYYNRTNRGGDLGAAHWWLTVPAAGYYEILAYMPNYTHTMAVTPHARYWIQHADVPSGQPDQLVVLDQNQNKCNWVSLGSYRYETGRSYGIYMGVGNIPTSVPIPNLIGADMIKAVPIGNPDKTNPDGNVSAPVNNSSFAGPGVIPFTAQAWDNSSGVAAVEFHVKYNGQWNNVATDTSAPYAYDWSIPAGVAPQQMIFTIHVKDRSGNEVLDPGGYRYVNYTLKNVNTGFQVARDGYNFENYGEFDSFAFTMYDYANLAGFDNACLVRIGNFCLVWHPVAQLKLTLITTALSIGRCGGMSATSMRLFQGSEKPADFQSGASSTYQLNRDSVKKYIIYNQAVQYLPDFESKIKPNMYGTAQDILIRLHTALSKGKSDQQILALKSNGGFGHGVTPYGIQDRGNSVYWILIYDNNFPNRSDLYVEVDLKTNQWYYNGSRGYPNLEPSIGLIPLSYYNQYNQWPAASATTPLVTAGETSGSSIVIMGDRRALITDASGRRVGWLDGEYINEIPDAELYRPLGDESINPQVRLPEDIGYTVTFEDAPAAGGVKAAAAGGEMLVARIGLGYLAQVEGIDPGAGAQNVVNIAADGSAVALRSSGADDQADVTLFRDGASEDLVVRVEGADLGADGQMQLVEEDGRYKLDNSDNSGGQFDVRIDQVNADGLNRFYHKAVEIPAGETRYLDITHWDGEGSMPLLVDHNSDGQIDETIDLENDDYFLYLPLFLH